MYQVDPFWPKPLPNNGVMGSVVGLSIDSRDHIWITHRGNVAPKESGMMAGTNGHAAAGWFSPPQPGDKRRISSDLLRCRAAGPRVRHGGQPVYFMGWAGPRLSMAGVDARHHRSTAKTTCGSTNQGHQMLKFTRQGKFLLQIGREGQSKGNTDTANLNRAAEAEVDLAANEVYVADGYGNRRVIVFDADTGAYKRHWGAYGKKPDDTDPGPYDPAAPLPQVFRTVHCAQIANDGLVYVCDRANDRIQVFKKDGTFVKEMQIAKDTLGDGSVFDIAFSRDTPQRHAFVADGANHRVWTDASRATAGREPLRPGRRYPGQFYSVHNVSLDSKGNV
jgi:hypothetical protein